MLAFWRPAFWIDAEVVRVHVRSNARQDDSSPRPRWTGNTVNITAKDELGVGYLGSVWAGVDGQLRP